jgi:hypothetical protein
MMRHTLVLMMIVIGVAMASAAAADPRDSVDRGDRLDTDALRDDVGTNRLKVPSHPLFIVPPEQPAATSNRTKSKKSSASGSGGH